MKTRRGCRGGRIETKSDVHRSGLNSTVELADQVGLCHGASSSRRAAERPPSPAAEHLHGDAIRVLILAKGRPHCVYAHRSLAKTPQRCFALRLKCQARRRSKQSEDFSLLTDQAQPNSQFCFLCLMAGDCVYHCMRHILIITRQFAPVAGFQKHEKH